MTEQSREVYGAESLATHTQRLWLGASARAAAVKGAPRTPPAGGGSGRGKGKGQARHIGGVSGCATEHGKVWPALAHAKGTSHTAAEDNTAPAQHQHANGVRLEQGPTTGSREGL